MKYKNENVRTRLRDESYVINNTAIAINSYREFMQINYRIVSRHMHMWGIFVLLASSSRSLLIEDFLRNNSFRTPFNEFFHSIHLGVSLMLAKCNCIIVRNVKSSKNVLELWSVNDNVLFQEFFSQ